MATNYKGQHGPFIPRRLREWAPECMRTAERRCHWCAWQKMRMCNMFIAVEAPTRYYFCSMKCLEQWREQRHDPDVSAWLRNCTGDRYKILKRLRDEAEADGRGDAPPVRGVDHVQMPVCESVQLPSSALLSECRDSKRRCDQ